MPRDELDAQNLARHQKRQAEMYAQGRSSPRERDGPVRDASRDERDRSRERERRDRRDGDRSYDRERSYSDQKDRRDRDDRDDKRYRQVSDDRTRRKPDKKYESYEDYLLNSSYDEMAPLQMTDSPDKRSRGTGDVERENSNGHRPARGSRTMGTLHGRHSIAGQHARSPRPINGPGSDLGIGDKEISGTFGGLDHAHWLECAECGELCVYTCLALSDASTFTHDTRRLLFKIFSALFIQLIVPVLLLCIEVEEQIGNISLKPVNSEWKFRLIGACMLLYSLHHMYENCLDECRNMFLSFAFEEGLTFGYLWPLLLGEITNIFVGGILVVTMYMVFSNTVDGTELVLNAVAFNFLGGVDAEFVDQVSQVEAIQNFRDVTAPYKYVRSSPSFSCWQRIISAIMLILRWFLVVCGVIIAIAFAILPDRDDMSNTVKLPFDYSFEIPWQII